jgi:hypothetical protein
MALSSLKELRSKKMKKLLIALGLIMMLATLAMADQVRVGYPGSGYGPYQTGSGGEFTLTPINATGWLDLSSYGAQARNVGVAGSFQTFCIDGADYIYPYNATYNAAISQNAVRSNTSAAGDPVSVGTGWLYSQFASENWVSGLSYNYSGSPSARRADADLLQKALWWLEGQENISYSAGNKYMLAVVNRFGSEALAQRDGGWLFGVYSLNLTTANGSRAQDQLYYHASVPDSGSTVILLGFAMVALGLVSLRFRA